MLDVCDPQQVIDQTWQRLGCQVQLPKPPGDFFEKHGPTATVVGERRRYPRYYLRGKAILYYDGKEYCVYTKDMSRSGFCFLHHRQLFPCEKVCIYFASGALIEGTIVRCRRVADDCFECGAKLQQG